MRGKMRESARMRERKQKKEKETDSISVVQAKGALDKNCSLTAITMVKDGCKKTAPNGKPIETPYIKAE